MYPEQCTPECKGASLPRAPETNTSCSHTVQFYEDDALFLDSLSRQLCAALEAGGACVVVATPSHRSGLEERLAASGADLAMLRSTNRYVVLDARETLARFMVDEWPERDLFCRAIVPVFLRAQASVDRASIPVVIFGEMVALLWEQERAEAALQLEQFWTELAQRHEFALRCAYPMSLFANGAQSHLFQRICAEHGAVVPGESYTLLENEADRGSMISSLQQQALAARAALERRDIEIEQRLHAEEKLREAEAFAKAIIASSIDCLKVLDLEGRIIYVSPPSIHAMAISGVDEVLGQRWPDFWKEEDRPRARAAVAAAAGGSVGSFQGEYESSAGTKKAWDVKITPARDARGNVERLIVVSRDITELRAAQLAAIQAEKLAAAGRMAATIAHEINNPLEAVTNFIFLAHAAEGVPEEALHYLEAADRELTRVAHIARQTLGFYRGRSAERWINLYDLIQDALMIYERRLRNKEIEVDASVDPELQVFGRDGELRQVLLNLTANAIDASHTGGKIWFRARKTKRSSSGMDEGVRITLADNGAGMSPEVQRQVFAPFFTTKLEGGTGIGLWLTKCLIEQRGGYVQFRSRQGKKAGTVMALFLPSPKAVRSEVLEAAA